MASHSVRITSPYPNTTFTHTGRGGSGNVQRTSTIAKASVSSANANNAGASDPRPSVSTASTSLSSKSKTFTTGRGGAGNTYPIAQRQNAIFSFDEELAHQHWGSAAGNYGRRAQYDNDRSHNGSSGAFLAPVCHIGRGGAGNAIDQRRRQSMWSDGDDDVDVVGAGFRARRGGSDRESVSSGDSDGSAGASMGAGRGEDGTDKKRSWLGRLGR